MGHYWSEIDPAGAAEQDARINRIISVRRALKGIPLSAFEAHDLGPLMRVMGLEYKGILGTVDPSKDDLNLIERKIVAYKASLVGATKTRSQIHRKKK